MVSIAVSFLIMIIAVSVSSGFREEIRDGISDLTGDVQLLPADMNYINDSSPMSMEADFIADIESLPEVKRVVPAVYRAGIIKNGENIHGVLFKGVSREPGDADTVKLGVRIPSRLRDLIGVDVGDKMLSYFIGENVKVRNFKTKSAGAQEAHKEDVVTSFVYDVALVVHGVTRPRTCAREAVGALRCA